MTSWQVVRVVAGLFVVLSVVFGAPASPFFISQWWLVFTLFVGANVLQSGLSKWCLMETMLRKFGIKPGC